MERFAILQQNNPQIFLYRINVTPFSNPAIGLDLGRQRVSVDRFDPFHLDPYSVGPLVSVEKVPGTFHV